MDARKISELRENIRFQFGQGVAYDESIFCWFIKNQEQIEELKEQLKEEYSRGVKDGLNQAADIVKNY